MSTWTPSTRRSSSATIPTLQGQAGRGRRRASRRGRGGKLRGAQVRRALGDAVGHRQAALPRADLRQAALRRLSSAVSQQIRAIFADYTDLIEPLSLDEAYLDVTEDRLGLGSARAIAEDIRAPDHAPRPASPPRPGSATASSSPSSPRDQNKPDGLCVIPPQQGRGVRRHAAGQALPRRRPGHRGARWSGSASTPAPTSRAWTLRAARGAFRQLGRLVLADRPRHRRARGQARPALQIGQRRAHLRRGFARPRAISRRELERVAGYAWARIERAEVRGRTVTLKVKFADFTLITRSKSFAAPVAGPGRVRGRRAGAARRASARCPRGSGCSGLGLHSIVEPGEIDSPLQLGLAI